MRKRRRKRQHRGQQRDRRAFYGLGIALAAAFVIVLISQIILHRYVNRHNNGRILDGVFIGSTDVSGMTRKEATLAVQTDVADIGQKKLTLQLESGASAAVPLQELGIVVGSLDDVVGQALDYGRTGSAFKNYKILKQAEEKKLKKHLPLEYKITEKDAETALKEHLNGLLTVPVNAAVTHTEAGISIVEGRAGEALDLKQSVRAINTYLNNDWDGKEGSVTVAVTKIEPEVTAEDLSQITDLLGSYATYYYDDGTGRVTNVESGARHLSGIVMKPGEEISVNAMMEPYTEENGYALAASYESNKVVQTMGGGICQVSTTLYNAVLYAELEVTERYPHSMLVSYVEPSRDAAIADDVLDLMFKNNKQTPVYIEAVIVPNESITFNIYGKEMRKPGREISFYSESTQGEPPEGKRFVATDNYIGYFELQSNAHSEVTAQLWKVISEDGVEVSREVVNYSQYVEAPATYAVGTASDDPAAVDVMNTAIASQDESTIQAAIQQVLSGE